MTDLPDEFQYETRVDVNIAILREIAKIRFKERLPRIMAGVARELVAAGVVFPEASLLKVSLAISDEDWDAIYEDLK